MWIVSRASVCVAQARQKSARSTLAQTRRRARRDLWCARQMRRSTTTSSCWSSSSSEKSEPVGKLPRILCWLVFLVQLCLIVCELMCRFLTFCFFKVIDSVRLFFSFEKKQKPASRATDWLWRSVDLTLLSSLVRPKKTLSFSTPRQTLLARSCPTFPRSSQHWCGDRHATTPLTHSYILTTCIFVSIWMIKCVHTLTTYIHHYHIYHETEMIKMTEIA